MNFDLLLYVVALGAILATFLILYAMMAGRKKKKEEPLEVLGVGERRSLKVGRSVTSTEAKRSQDELRILDLEREVLSHAIRRLYEAQAEGRISDEERDSLARGYKAKLMEIKDTISRSESIIALHELETMQSDLIKLFDERFDEINDKITNLRSRLAFEPVEEAPIPPQTPPPLAPPEKAKRKARKPLAPKKTEAEKRIEEIRAEVEKVLERLGQIEVEA